MLNLTHRVLSAGLGISKHRRPNLGRIGPVTNWHNRYCNNNANFAKMAMLNAILFLKPTANYHCDRWRIQTLRITRKPILSFSWRTRRDRKPACPNGCLFGHFRMHEGNGPLMLPNEPHTAICRSLKNRPRIFLCKKMANQIIQPSMDAYPIRTSEPVLAPGQETCVGFCER
jgi:hypothetical protein